MERILEGRVELEGRLDKVLSQTFKLSRERVKESILKGLVLVEGRVVKKPSHRVRKGSLVLMHLLEEKKEIKPKEGSLEVIYEDEHICVLEKPYNLAVHPHPGNYENTLLNLLLSRFEKLSKIGGRERLGIVHRLDKEVGGLMVVAKTDRAHLNLQRQFKERKVLKIYRAIVVGKMEERMGVIDLPIGRDPRDRTKMKVFGINYKEAKSEYLLIKSGKNYSVLDIKIKTGRTHQIRVHLSFMGHPIFGDKKYGYKGGLEEILKGRIALFSKRLGFVHPTEGKYMEFERQEPKFFKELEERIAKS